MDSILYNLFNLGPTFKARMVVQNMRKVDDTAVFACALVGDLEGVRVIKRKVKGFK